MTLESVAVGHDCPSNVFESPIFDMVPSSGEIVEAEKPHAVVGTNL